VSIFGGRVSAAVENNTLILTVVFVILTRYYLQYIKTLNIYEDLRYISYGTVICRSLG
jgi:hypothetical protein